MGVKERETTASESNLFEHLINVWEFRPGPTPETCDLYFMVDFKFRSPLYRQVASMFFREVVSRLVSSFIERCRLLYGPGAIIEQKA
ncbi:Coenzyme Q-binding protein COQ10-like protein mitochondrial [Bienertia sinuspersici]